MKKIFKLLNLLSVIQDNFIRSSLHLMKNNCTVLPQKINSVSGDLELKSDWNKERRMGFVSVQISWFIILLTGMFGCRPWEHLTHLGSPEGRLNMSLLPASRMLCLELRANLWPDLTQISYWTQKTAFGVSELTLISHTTRIISPAEELFKKRKRVLFKVEILFVLKSLQSSIVGLCNPTREVLGENVMRMGKAPFWLSALMCGLNSRICWEHASFLLRVQLFEEASLQLIGMRA